MMPKLTSPSSEQPGSESIKIVLAFAAIYLVWGSTYLAIRYAVETIPPLVAAGIRHTVAGGVLLGWAWVRGYRPRREHWIEGLVLGTVGRSKLTKAFHSSVKAVEARNRPATAAHS